jgi:hypothetical protein
MGQVFQKFFRVDAPAVRRAGGAGLGLSISRLLSEAMGGELTLESVEGRGSRFSLRITLPVTEMFTEQRPITEILLLAALERRNLSQEAMTAAGYAVHTFTDAADSVLAGDAFGADEDEDEMQPHKFWVQLSGEKEVAVPGRPDKVRWKRPAGQLLISVQLVPAAEAKLYPAGNGRSAPNQHPKLPRPVGRLRFTLNPFALVHQFLGDKLCAYLVCALALLACVLIAYYMIPAVLANLFTTVLFEKLFSQTGIIILGSVGVVLILLLLCVCGRR